LAVLDTLSNTSLIADADIKGKRICDTIARQLEGNQHIVAIRHQGLMIGIELDAPCGELVGKALEKGLLINVTADSTIRLLPPLLIDDAQIDLLTETLSALIKEHSH
ncbi:MAG: aminotransferase class III-fold pyridoxal phosphate-dependent enzyme, partial [Methylomonas sp.]|nr:aminotransferase class III-fold pyridoxal phosphate-dependent enzyme [Methylomonas sp.]